VGPVFSAGSVTSERERETLDLLLTTTITPWQILWGKLLSGLRVSLVLTAFLTFPLLLALVFVIKEYYLSIPTFIGYLIIVGLTCLTTSTLALFCSCVFRKTSISLLVTYSLILFLFCMPIAVSFFANNFFADSDTVPVIDRLTCMSPFAAAFEIPLYVKKPNGDWLWTRVTSNSVPNFFGYPLTDLYHFGSYIMFTLVLNIILFLSMVWLFNMRWRVSAATT
jgi:ABC-type transport system involved in multi-copper enzyme maturation permease subunit